MNNAFENTSKILEQRIVEVLPTEDIVKVETDFNEFILAFKKNKLVRKDLDSLSRLVKKANEDKDFTQDEAKEVLTFIETITPGLK